MRLALEMKGHICIYIDLLHDKIPKLIEFKTLFKIKR